MVLLLQISQLLFLKLPKIPRTRGNREFHFSIKFYLKTCGVSTKNSDKIIMKKFSSMPKLGISIILFFLFISKGNAQFGSTFLSADAIGKGSWEFTGLYSSLSAGYDGESQGVLNNYGFLTGIGISEKTEIRVRYDRFTYKEEGSIGFNILSVGPKFSTGSERFSFYLPVGVNFADELASWMTEPSLIFTFPLGNNFQINATPSYIIPLEEGTGIEDGILKLNLGLGIIAPGNWIFRPEATLQYWAQDIGDGHFLALGIGITKRLGKE